MANINTPPSSPTRVIIVDVATQTLRVMEGPQLVAQFPVSTSKFGLGFKEGSFQTPTGNFLIHEKIGDSAPAWTIFRARQNTNEIALPGGNDDFVLSRILTLDGISLKNRNTLQRYVYIHGTNQEDTIGTPTSHGCVRLKNNDMITLFDMVAAGTPVSIIPPDTLVT